MRYFISFWSFLFIIGLFIPQEALAQKRVKRDSILQTFKEGTLIVRLKSNAKKLKQIDQLLESERVSDKQKKNLQKRKEEMIASQVPFNLDLANAFDSLYTFSAVRFMYDKDLPKLKSGDHSDIFLDKNLNPVTNPAPVNGEIFFFGEGNNANSGNSMDGILVMDSNSDQMPGWFPNFYRAKSGFKSFMGLFSKGDNIYRPAAGIVERFQGSLNEMWKGYLARNPKN